MASPWPATALVTRAPRAFPTIYRLVEDPPARRERPRGKCEGKVAMDSVPGLRTRRRRQGIAALRSYHHRMAVVGSRHRGKRAKGWGELATTA